MAAFSLGLILVLFKEFLLVGFDAAFASVQGWPVLAIDVLLTSLIAITVVIGLPAVGVVMMTALLIIPGVTARFWSDRLSLVLAIAVAIGMLMGVIGTAISATYAKMPAGPVITLVGTAFFVASALFAPRRGFVSRLLDEFARSTRGGVSTVPEVRAWTSPTTRGSGNHSAAGIHIASPSRTANGRSHSPFR